MYNVLGAVITMFVIYPYSKFILMLSQKMGAGPEMSIGINHFVFNLVWVVGIIPLIPLSIKILEFLIPGQDSRKELTKFVKLDYDLIQTLPEAAIRMAKDQTLQMGQLVQESLHMTQNYLKNHDEEDIEVIEQFEEIVNQLDRDLIKYLIAIGKDAASGAALTKDFIANLEIVKNIERIGDISTNLGEFYQIILENKEILSDDAMEDLDAMYQLVFNMIEKSFLIFKTGNLKELGKLMEDEERLNLMNQDFREKHFRRIADGITTAEIISSVFVEILGSLERIGDHAVNIVELSVREA
ncbi:MAG TPA: Na/Pi cotransporter family protein [Epulopiscium sp.]|nr:Na/Pi cotransporter family protein [Candidatus Epulonipiscium sp.]